MSNDTDSQLASPLRLAFEMDGIRFETSLSRPSEADEVFLAAERCMLARDKIVRERQQHCQRVEQARRQVEMKLREADAAADAGARLGREGEASLSRIFEAQIRLQKAEASIRAFQAPRVAEEAPAEEAPKPKLGRPRKNEETAK